MAKKVAETTTVRPEAIELTYPAIQTKRTTDYNGNSWVTARWTDGERGFGKTSARTPWDQSMSRTEVKDNHLNAVRKLADGYTEGNNKLFPRFPGHFEVTGCVDGGSWGYIFAMEWVHDSEGEG